MLDSMWSYFVILIDKCVFFWWRNNFNWTDLLRCFCWWFFCWFLFCFCFCLPKSLAFFPPFLCFLNQRLILDSFLSANIFPLILPDFFRVMILLNLFIVNFLSIALMCSHFSDKCFLNLFQFNFFPLLNLLFILLDLLIFKNLFCCFA